MGPIREARKPDGLKGGKDGSGMSKTLAQCVLGGSVALTELWHKQSVVFDCQCLAM